MQPEEFQALKHLRTATGPRSCCGDEPCVHAALHKGGWYCRGTLQFTGAHLALGSHPERVVCDEFTPFAPGPNPGPLDDLCQKFKAY